MTVSGAYRLRPFTHSPDKQCDKCELDLSLDHPFTVQTISNGELYKMEYLGLTEGLPRTPQLLWRLNRWALLLVPIMRTD